MPLPPGLGFTHRLPESYRHQLLVPEGANSLPVNHPGPPLLALPFVVDVVLFLNQAKLRWVHTCRNPSLASELSARKTNICEQYFSEACKAPSVLRLVALV